MLVLVQNVSPLDLVSSLVISLMWVPPLVLLTGHALGLLYRVSTPDPRPSWLTRTVDRTPDWAVAFTAMWAALTWQLRFLPALVLVVLAIAGLTVRDRSGDRPRLVRWTCVVLPCVVAVALLVLFVPSVVAAFAHGEVTLALLLVLPPALTPLLTGPVPARAARVVTHAPAAVAALVGPFLLIVIFLRTPVLPSIALELHSRDVVLGYALTVDDTMTTLLDDSGAVRFVPNTGVSAKVLCGGAEEVPVSVVAVHGWHVEKSMLEWALPSREPRPAADPRCAGRPL